MNNLTSQQRKLVYLIGMAVLLIPIVTLGFPSSAKHGKGGILAEMRKDNDLGESTLGDVDPSSATMNLVLLGLRGPAACLLWVQMDEQKDAKDWAAMRATTDSIIKLQPHFQKVWKFHGWNLAFNVSVEWDAVKDRWFWVKEGAKFYKRGVGLNYKYPELYWDYAYLISNKIGKSDEWRQFRRFFRIDPDKDAIWRDGIPGPDRELNPDDEDNYVVARRWFQDSNDKMDTYGKEQHIMDRSLFRGYPGRAIIDQASLRQKEGDYDEETREIWARATAYWRDKYGMEEFSVAPGIKIHLNWQLPDLREYLKTAEKPAEFTGTQEEFARSVRKYVGTYQDMTNYRYWDVKCYSEQLSTTLEAHLYLSDAMQWLAEGDDQLAKRMGLLGMEKYEIVLQDSGDRVNTIKDDDLAIEEGMLGIMTWQHALQHLGEKIPAKFPLLTLWERHQNRKAQIEEEFDRQINPAREENRTEDEIRDEENRKQRRIERAKKLFPDIK
jgi:hypothetical protein